MTEDQLVRFMAKVRRETNGGCWVWLGYLMPEGYGQFGVGHRKIRLTHRLAYEHFVGPIPVGLQLDHLCRNRRCCNPNHLEPVTQEENRRRGVNVGRTHTHTAKTHCPKGHPYDYFHAGKRSCKTCRTEQSRASKRRRRGACVECGVNQADPPSHLCPGCEAYQAHTGAL